MHTYIYIYIIKYPRNIYNDKEGRQGGPI
jgi:hypothetical protein